MSAKTQVHYGVQALLLGALSLLALASFSPAASPSFPGLPDPGQPKLLSIQGGAVDAGGAKSATLIGPDARLQLVVSAGYADGQLRDFTHQVTYDAAPAGIVNVSEAGLVTPIADGHTTITASHPSGIRGVIDITVSRTKSPAPINFPNQIVPIFTKLGCNSGACHGKAAGQNGFRMSLLGFDPQQDYRVLVSESRGRRVFPAAPAQSLLLLKPTNVLAHGGGERLKPDSHEYRLIYRWISQGMPYGSEKDPTLSQISVFPPARTLPQDAEQQLLVIATYSDGSTEDVTQTAQYDVNDKEMAEANDGGRIKMLGRPGDVAVMVRYQGHVGVFRGTVPVGAAVDKLPAPRNFVDTLAFEKFKALGLPPSNLCDDATFVRRVSIDITGRLPSADEARTFLADPDPAKRDKLIDRLLASDAYADFFADKWSAILRNRRDKESYARGDYLFHEWVRQNLASNKPYDRIVRELLTATGDPEVNPAVIWYRQADDASKQVEDTAQLFLGVRIQCAHCHHHPYEKWAQQDYYGLAAFFSKVGRKLASEQDEFRVFNRRGEAEMENPATRKIVKPTGLGSPTVQLTSDQDPRVSLVDWMTAKGNPFFARSLANRYWKHFMGRGLVDPEDDMRETNPPSNPKLLDALASHFAESGFDLKDLIRTICRSDVYQLTSQPNEFNGRDAQNFSHFYPRRLTAEVLLDAIDVLNGTHTQFKGVAAGTSAVGLPDMDGVDSYFLRVFGRPAGSSACECERTGESSLAQSLQLLNSNDLYEKLSNGIAKKLADPKDTRPDEQKLSDLYLAAFSRPPTPSELAKASDYLHHHETKEAKDKEAAYEDVLWAMVNTKEFLFNH